MATVELTFTADPAHVRTARLIATAVARRTGICESLLDEVRLAVGEACSHAVDVCRHRRPQAPIRLEMSDDAGRFEVVISDATNPAVNSGEVGGALPRKAFTDQVASGAPDAPWPLPDGPVSSSVRLAVIAGLADDVEMSPDGLRVKMSWPTSLADSAP